MRFLAILAAKIVIFMTKITNSGSGTTLPGLVAEKIYPNIIADLVKRFKYTPIVITGTNGKTTVAKMLAEILTEDGFKVLYNSSGSNMTRGIASALLFESNLFGTRMQSDIAVFEIDEATMAQAMPYVKPGIVVVNNLFRDQLDRYGELDKTAAIIGRSIKGFTNLTVLLNADDPLVASLAGYVDGRVEYFGVNSTDIKAVSSAAMDSKDCVNCGHELKYKNRYFGHLGIWECPNCKNARPKLNHGADNVVIHPGSSEFSLNLAGEELKIKIPLTGLYNVYNALAAAGAAKIACCAGPATIHALGNFAAAFGRMELVEKDGKKAMLLLVKNPTGASQSLSAVLADGLPKKIVMALNDNFADGTDVSWIWDIDIESQNTKDVTFYATGIRSEDMALRLKYAEIPTENVKYYKDIKECTKQALNDAATGEVVYILPTYTALMEVRSMFESENNNLSNLGKATKRGL
jgi:UDP-N-acetylmuramyl tripeptide synthase